MTNRTDKEKIVIAIYTACSNCINEYGSLLCKNQGCVIKDFPEYEEAIEELPKSTNIEQS